MQRGSLHLQSDLEQTSSPTFGKKSASLYLLAFSHEVVPSTSVGFAACPVLIQGEETCALKCTILKWLIRELEVKIPSCSQINSSVKVDELCSLLHRRGQLFFLSFVCS